MNNEFVQLDDHGQVFVRWNSVVAVEQAGEETVVLVNGGGELRLVNTNPEKVFAKFAAARERYAHEMRVVSFACQLVNAQNALDGGATEHDQYALKSQRETAIKNLVNMVNSYRSLA